MAQETEDTPQFPTVRRGVDTGAFIRDIQDGEEVVDLSNAQTAFPSTLTDSSPNPQLTLRLAQGSHSIGVLSGLQPPALRER